jgi:hypothetical protein
MDQKKAGAFASANEVQRHCTPFLVGSFDYSALGPWQENVEARIAEIADLIHGDREGGLGMSGRRLCPAVRNRAENACQTRPITASAACEQRKRPALDEKSRMIQTDIGPVAVRQARLRARGGEEAGERIT